MKKLMSILMAAVLMALMLPFAAAEDEAVKLLGTWYFVEQQDDAFPGVTFTANGEVNSFTVYTDGEKLISVIHQQDAEDHIAACVYEDGVLKADSLYALEGDRLVASFGSIKQIYAREAAERRIPYSLSETVKGITAEDYNGVYDLVQYGKNNAFANAEEIGLTGEASIIDGKMMLKWSKDGDEKEAEITFDSELDRGRLYTVADGVKSYIVSILSDGTLYLNIGLNEMQWILKNRNKIGEETEHLQSARFEEAYADRTDWFATEESRAQIAKLLLQEAPDKDKIETNGSVYLMSVAGAPLVLCEGKGENRNYIFSIGRGYSQDTGAFIYYDWRFALNYKDESADKSILDKYVEWMDMFQSWKIQAADE